MPLRHHNTGFGGGGLRVFQSPAFQDGSGWGSFIAGLVSKVAPAAKSAFRVSKALGKKALNSELGQSLKVIYRLLIFAQFTPKVHFIKKSFCIHSFILGRILP